MKIRLLVLLISLPSNVFAQGVYEPPPETNIGRYWSIKTGAFLPYGNLDNIGNHPTTGLAIGYRLGKLRLGLTADYRWLNAKNNFHFLYNDSVYTTKRLNSHINLGIDMAYQMAKWNKNEWYYHFGVGFDQAQVIKSGKYTERVFSLDDNIFTWDLNAGFEYVYAVNSKWEFGGNVRFHLTDYSRNNKTELTGGYFSCGIELRFYNYNVRKKKEDQLLTFR